MTPKNRTLEGKNRTLGGGGVKNRQKLSDIIYVRSLRFGTANLPKTKPNLNFGSFKNCSPPNLCIHTDLVKNWGCVNNSTFF